MLFITIIKSIYQERKQKTMLKQIYIAIIIFLFSLPAFAQKDSLPDFIDTTCNIFVPDKQNQLYSVYHKFNQLEVLGNNQIKILHIGDSHIQADVFTNYIRLFLGDVFYNLIGPPSPLLPYHLYKSNTPESYKIHVNGNWFAKGLLAHRNENSLLGYTAVKNDSCSSVIMLKINQKALPNTYFKRVMFFLSDSSSKLLQSDIIESKKISKFNDSIFVHTLQLKYDIDTMKLILCREKDTSLLKFYGCVVNNDYPGIVYHSIGYNGAKAEHYLFTNIDEYIRFYQYDWIIISLGTNDCFSNFDSMAVVLAYRKLIQKIRQTNENVPILLTTVMEHYKKKKINSNVKTMNYIIRYIAESENCALWDLYCVTGGENSINKWYAHNYTKHDKIHLNNRGYLLLAKLFVSAFINSYNQYLCQP